MSSAAKDCAGPSVARTKTTKTDRISVALLGVRRLAHRKIPWFIDVHITQVSKNYLLGTIEEDTTHVIFYNSKTMRIPSLQLNLTAIIPRSEMERYAEVLKDAPKGAVYYTTNRFFVCTETSGKTKHDSKTILEGMSTVIKACNEATTPIAKKFYYVSNGAKIWNVESFASLKDEIIQLENIVVSYQKFGFDTDDRGVQRETKSGQTRAKKPTPRGECWNRSPYCGGLRLMNPIIDLEVEGIPEEDAAVSSPDSSSDVSVASSEEEEDASGEEGNDESDPSDDVGGTSVPQKTFSQDQVDAIIKSKIASLTQEKSSTKKKGPILEEVTYQTDDEAHNTSSESEDSETEIMQPQKKLKVAVGPTTEEPYPCTSGAKIWTSSSSKQNFPTPFNLIHRRFISGVTETHTDVGGKEYVKSKGIKKTYKNTIKGERGTSILYNLISLTETLRCG